MTSGSEIITLQFGKFANFIGTHYFNIQETGFSYNPEFIPDISPDILFRASQDLKTGDVLNYTPRTVLLDDDVDLEYTTLEINEAESSGNFEFGSSSKETTENPNIKEINTFLSDRKKSLLSNSGANSSPLPQFLFKSHYVLENVNCWSHFMKPSLHERSVSLTTKNVYPNSTYNQCSSPIFPVREQLEDNIRFFAEECDNMQGFQILSEGDSTLSGTATSMLYHLKDEYGKKVSIFIPTYFTEEDATTQQRLTSAGNAVCCIADANDSVDLIIPLSLHTDPWRYKNTFTNRPFKNITYKGFDKYENSAVLAAGLELITLPYRMRSTKISMSEFCQINTLGRNICIAGMVVPFPIISNHSLDSILNSWRGPLFESISPVCSFDNSELLDMSYTFSKGITNINRSALSKNVDLEIDNERLEENLKNFIYTKYLKKCLKPFFSKPNFRVPPTFPKVLNNDYNITNPHMLEYGRLSEFYTLGCLTNSREVEVFLTTLNKHASILSKQRPELDINTAMETVKQLASNYSDAYDI